MRPHTLPRAAVAALSTGLVLLVGAAPAFAHVGVTPGSATPGSYSKITFRVPDELPGSSTVKVEIALPENQPVASVSVKPLPGWTVTTQKRTLSTPLTTDDGKVTTAVSRIVWSGGKIQPGQFQEFDVSIGPLPDHAGSMVFKALQTYDNGQVVRWIDPPAPDGAEPEHPAPVLRLVKSADATSTASSADAPAPTTAKDTAAGTDRTAAAPDPRHDASARVLGGVALAVALLAVALSFAARIRPSRGSRS